jgi:hypothetical protein
MKVPKGGGAYTQITNAGLYPQNVVVNGGSVYWTSEGPGSGSIMTASIDGGAPSAIVGLPYTPQPIAVDGTNVYWVSYPDIVQVPIDGGTPSTVESGYNAYEVVPGASRLYWLDTLHENLLALTPK